MCYLFLDNIYTLQVMILFTVITVLITDAGKLYGIKNCV